MMCEPLLTSRDRLREHLKNFHLIGMNVDHNLARRNMKLRTEAYTYITFWVPEDMYVLCYNCNGNDTVNRNGLPIVHIGWRCSNEYARDIYRINE